MSDDPSNELQSALLTALKADATLAAIVDTRVYDNVPQKTDYPYVAIGDDTFGDLGSHTFKGMEITVNIHCWSQYAGRKQVKQMMEAIYDLLHEGTLTLSGHTVVFSRFEFAETMKDPDGVTHHGIQRFRVITRRQ